jgi:phosphate-selective porin OprO/OprP
MKSSNAKFGAVVLFLQALVLLIALAWAGPARAEKSVAEEILDILRANNQITEVQYDTLMEKAKKEQLQPKDFEAFWDNGLKFKSADGNFKMHIGGRIQTDWAYIDADDDLKEVFDDLEGHGAEFRRARLEIEATMWEYIIFKTQLDFAGADVEFKDVYIGMTDLPYVGSVVAGHQKEPFSLEELTSSKYITFMERSLPNVFAPSRNLGIGVSNAVYDERLTWAAGLYEEVEDDEPFAFNDFSDYNFSARITGLPWALNEEHLLHLGLSYNHRFRSEEDNPLRFRQRPEAHLTDVRLVDTGPIPSDGANLINPEIALVYGPFSVQGEYTHAFVSAKDDLDEDLDFSGFYVFASYFLTGEHRVYDEGAFGRVKPAVNFHPTKGGWGAWEVAARYSHLDLDDNAIQGGKEDDITFGLNWYLNPNTRWMFNYVYAMVDDIEDLDDDGSANIFQTRLQVEF